MSWGPKTITHSASQGGFHDRTTVVVDAASYRLTPAEYFVGAFLLTLILTLLSIPLSLIDTNAKMMQPFRALTREGGAPVAQSLALSFSGIVPSVAVPHTILTQRQPVPYLSSLLKW